MNSVIKTIKTAALLSVAMLIICGFLYPLLLTGISQILFPHQANGSLLYVGDKAVGSEIIGQDFKDPRFMKSRPSAVNYNTYTAEQKADGSYAGVGSGSQNLAPTNPALVQRVQQDMQAFLERNPTIKKQDIPTDLMTASGSGLDPHISPESAEIQIPALAQSTGLSEETLKDIVENNTQHKLLGIFGEETVNVLKVNLEIAKEIGLI